MLRRYRDWPFVSTALVVINVIVFCVCIFTGGMFYYKGGVESFAILEQHEYGRLIWAMFLHSDTAHLFNNMIILFFLGAMLEKETGHVWLAIIYFLSGMGGNIVSLARKVMTESNSLSVGASGAVFGLDGLLLALVIFSQDFRNAVPPGRVVLMIALSLYDGFIGSNIDNAAHVGGLIVGFLAGIIFVLVQNMRNKKNRREVQF